MKKLASILLVSLTLNALAQHGQEFSIRGSIADPYEGYIILQYGSNRDTTEVINQEFSFTGSVDYIKEARFRTSNSATMEYFYLENSEIKVELSIAPPSIVMQSVSGSRTALLMEETIATIQSLDANNYEEELYTVLDTLIQNNSRNQFSAMILSEVSMDPILSFEQIKSLYLKMDSAIVHPDDKNVLLQSLEKLKNIRIGGELMDFKFPDANGDLIGIADYDSDLLLVEFWASDCRPCRIANPQLVELYKSHKERGLEILGVSLDGSSEAWQRAIEKDGLPWKQTLVPQGFENATLRKLGIQYLPSNYLIDQNGTIKAINISPTELKIILEQNR